MTAIADAMVDAMDAIVDAMEHTIAAIIGIRWLLWQMLWQMRLNMPWQM